MGAPAERETLRELPWLCCAIDGLDAVIASVAIKHRAAISLKNTVAHHNRSNGLGLDGQPAARSLLRPPLPENA